MLRLAGMDAMRERLESTLADGSALEKFRAMVAAQGGDLAQVDDPGKLPAAPHIETIGAPRGGYIKSLNAREVGMVVVELGGGRAKKGDPIDHSVGVRVHTKIGDKVESGAPLFTVHARNSDDFRAAKDRLLNAVGFSDEEVAPLPLFYDAITGG
jgi:pyrimidine-nucleoside phosphorylase